MATENYSASCWNCLGEFDAIAARLVDGHLKYCVTRAIGSGQTPDEIQGLLTPLQTLLFTRR